MPSYTGARPGWRIQACRLGAADEAAWLEQRLSAPGADVEVQVACHEAPAVILGRSQARRWPLDALARGLGMPVLVRASGGGVVLAGPWMVSAAAVFPAHHALARAGAMPAYRWFGRLHERVLAGLGLLVQARPPETLPSRAPDDPIDWMCFASLSPWEVSHGELKVGGLAQVRRRGAVALVSGIHVVRPPWERLAEAFNCPDIGLRMDERAVDLARLGCSVGAQALSELLAREFRDDPACRADSDDRREIAHEA